MKKKVGQKMLRSKNNALKLNSLVWSSDCKEKNNKNSNMIFLFACPLSIASWCDLQ